LKTYETGQKQTSEKSKITWKEKKSLYKKKNIFACNGRKKNWQVSQQKEKIPLIAKSDNKATMKIPEGFNPSRDLTDTAFTR